MDKRSIGVPLAPEKASRKDTEVKQGTQGKDKAQEAQGKQKATVRPAVRPRK
jgi:hypothetical protein